MPNRTTKLTATLAGLVLAAAALAGCTAAPAESTETPAAQTQETPKPEPTVDTASATDDVSSECTSNASISTPYHDPTTNDPVKLSGKLVDRGASDVAAGTVGYNAEGEIESYTVAAGDTLIGIGDRFCIDYVTVAVYNHAWPPAQTIQPDDVLVLRPDPTAPWSPDGV